MSDVGSASAPRLPYKKWWPFAMGVLFGLAARVVFSQDWIGDAMSAAFLLVTPFAVGAVTVYFAERQQRRTVGYHATAGALANILFILGTTLSLIEGIICAIIVAPLFIVLGLIGGLVMGAICRYTNWPSHSVSLIAVMPMLAAVVLPAHGHTDFEQVYRSVRVDAPADVVWQQLLNARQIKPEEVEHGWMFRIGVPLPVAGVTRQQGQTLVRKVTMGKQIHFEQIAKDWKPGRYVHWQYRYQPDSFPKYALDEHVTVGGQYFDLTDTEYTIAPVDQDTVELTIRINYRMTTQFNWYTRVVARLLFGNVAQVNLDFNRRRAQALYGSDA